MTSTPTLRPADGPARVANRMEVAAAFRDVMASVATPVSVVTAFDGLRPHGTTVSAFASLSFDPVMVLVSLARTSRLLPLLRTGGRVGINLLSSLQGPIARDFAAKDRDRFESAQWHAEAEVPVLDGVVGWLACDITGLVPGGDHVIVLGEVVAAQGGPLPPLTYHQRRFGTHLNLD